jgi:hypothetical protein
VLVHCGRALEANAASSLILGPSTKHAINRPPPASNGRDEMDLDHPAPEFKPPPAVRHRLPDRRANSSFSFEYEGHQYRATAGRFADGRLAEIFLHAQGKLGTPLQSNADTVAILTSLLLQHGVDPDVIWHSITGPIAIALQTFMAEAA